ncbi:ABC transporter permease [Cellulosimicrobium cellulans]|uniref:ABC transporter permease n=1 Tax=Cellulosimicrobium cellulans TaxID=1710 RepID=UPI001EDA30B7|nr:ABC transporter permease [Cellulosimicrobium cellulans]UKJ65222.1 ABC transporter permease [Cellulosimicrobium cellulans]
MTTTVPAVTTPSGRRAPTRPGPRAWVALIGAEARMVVRDTAGLVMPFGMPVLILVMYGVSDATTTVVPGSGGRTAFDVFVIPVVLAIVVGIIGVINMPSFLAYYRRSGVLKRLSVTPASPAMVLVAQVVVSIAQTAGGVALALVVATAAFDARLPASPGVALGVLALASAAMYAMGMLVAAVAPTPNAALALGLVAFFAFGATGGMFGAVSNLPEPVARVGELLPFGAAVQALGDAWAGQPVEAAHLVALGGAVLVGTVAAARWFRWT